MCLPYFPMPHTLLKAAIWTSFPSSDLYWAAISVLGSVEITGRYGIHLHTTPTSSFNRLFHWFLVWQLLSPWNEFLPLPLLSPKLLSSIWLLLLSKQITFQQLECGLTSCKCDPKSWEISWIWCWVSQSQHYSFTSAAGKGRVACRASRSGRSAAIWPQCSCHWDSWDVFVFIRPCWARQSWQ